jgi:hypothetical protein
MKSTAVLAFAALAYGTDICSKWPTCDTCLNVTSEASSSITDIANAFGANVAAVSCSSSLTARLNNWSLHL